MSDTFDVLNPATEDVVKTVHMASADEIDAVVAKDTFYITEMEKTPKLINGNWVLNKKSYGPIDSHLFVSEVEDVILLSLPIFNCSCS